MNDDLEIERMDLRRLEALREEAEDPDREPTWAEIRGLLAVIDWHEEKHEQLTTRLSNISYEADLEWNSETGYGPEDDSDLIPVLGDDEDEG